MNGKSVLIIVPSNFPDGDAGAVRDYYFAKMYQELGYTVSVIGEGRKDRTGVFNGIPFISVYIDARTKASHIIRFIRMHNKYVKAIEEYISKFGYPEIIHINALQERTINYILRIAKKHNIKVIHDSTEWYSECEFKRGKWDKAYILRNRLNTKVIRAPIRVVGISRYLENYYSKKGLKSTRIPVVMEANNHDDISWQEDHEGIRLVYAGNPGNKDYLSRIIEATIIVYKQNKSIELHLLGISEEQAKGISSREILPECIVTHGRVPRSKVLEMLKKADFSVLLRPADERYAKAGFPTKVVEAMSQGVAMICNISSDLDLYLVDGDNAIIVDGDDVDAMTNALLRVASMGLNDIEKIKTKARNTAMNEFNYKKWVHCLKSLIG